MKIKPSIIALVRLFSRTEPIAGLEIADDFLRLALMSFDKKKSAQEIEFLVEQPLPQHVVSHGVIVDETVFSKNLQNVLQKIPVKVNYLILSLPIDEVFTQLFSFPANTPQEKLDASMKLIAEYQMPFSIGDVYLDWEKLETKEKNEFLLASIPKKIVDQYIHALLKAELHTVAVETHPASFLRTLNLPEKDSILIDAKNTNASYVYIVKNKALRYSRTLPIAFIPLDEKENEIKRIKNFYEAEQEPIKENIDFAQGKIIEKYKHPDLREAKSSRWAISLGAATRGLLPRSKDKLISLMPIGTEKAYEYQRATAFSKFLSILILWLSVLFSLTYLGTWFLMLSVQQRTVKQIDLLSSLPLPAESALLEARARKLNGLTQTVQQIIKTTPHWSIVVKELQARVGSGVAINSFRIAGVDSPVTLLGVAATRADLKLFKKSLEESALFKNVAIPLTNLEQKEKIPFSVTLQIKEPHALYQDVQ